jgi:hypothetical protein
MLPSLLKVIKGGEFFERGSQNDGYNLLYIVFIFGETLFYHCDG